jgi:threonine dehydratase
MIPNPIPLAAIRAARERIAGLAVRTPLIRLHVEGDAEIYLKLESLQPIGSFKIRGAANAIYSADPGTLERGVWTASAGNMAQGVAWCARASGLRCTVVVPDHAPKAKTAAVERLGARIVRRPFDEWWRLLAEPDPNAYDGLFVHPVQDPAVIAGNGTIGLEILEDLPNVDSVVVPYGGGGLSCGIASAIAALKPDCRVFASEVETATRSPVLAAGRPLTVEYTASFVDGIGGRSVLTDMWPLASRLLAGSIVVSLADTAATIRLLLERARVLAEGAGASSVAAARSGKAGGQRTVAVVSGGNIDLAKVGEIIGGAVPGPGGGG